MPLRFAVLLLILSGAYEARSQGVPPPLVPPFVGFSMFDDSPSCVTTAQDLADGLDPCEHRVGDNLLILTRYSPGIPHPDDFNGSLFQDASLVVEGDLGNISSSAFLNHCNGFRFGEPLPFFRTSYSTPGTKTITATAFQCFGAGGTPTGTVFATKILTINICPATGCAPPQATLRIRAAIGAGALEPTQGVSSPPSAPASAHFPLGSSFRIAAFDENGNPVSSTFSLQAATVAAGVELGALFPSLVALKYTTSQPSEANFQAIHRGSVNVQIIPDDPNIEPAVVSIVVEEPTSLGNMQTAFDSSILAFAHKRGIPPQFIKGQIERESAFNPRSWRYEPIASSGDLGQVSRGRTPPLREIAPFSSYRLATTADDGGLSQGNLLVAADIAPRGEGRFPLMIRDSATGQPRALQPADPNPTARELYEVNNGIQHWSRWARRDVVDSIRRNPAILESWRRPQRPAATVSFTFSIRQPFWLCAGREPPAAPKIPAFFSTPWRISRLAAARSRLELDTSSPSTAT